MKPEDIPDPRTLVPGICGVTSVGGLGIEWICIKKVHAKIYHNRKGGIIYDNNKNADRHYMVNRYPNRPVPGKEEQ